MGRTVLILGGARSGKSSFARRLAEETGAPVLFLAAGRPVDEEMRLRIERHRDERPESWRTVEEPLDAPGALRREAAGGDTVLFDCVSVWAANVLTDALGEEPSAAAIVAAEEDLLARVDGLLDWQRGRSGALLLVSNEVGLGVVPPYPLGRAFRDALGLAHQRIAAVADEAYLLVAGLPQRLK